MKSVEGSCTYFLNSEIGKWEFEIENVRMWRLEDVILELGTWKFDKAKMETRNVNNWKFVESAFIQNSATNRGDHLLQTIPKRSYGALHR